MAQFTRTTRVLATLGTAVLTLAGIAGASQAHAAPAQARSAHYTAPDGSYEFAYPADWTQQQMSGIQVEFVSPDQNAAVAATSVSGEAGDAKSVLKAFLKGAKSRAMGKASYHKYPLSDGSTLLEADTLARLPDGHVGLVTVEFVSTGGRVYLLAGVIDNVNAPTWKQDCDELARTMASYSVDTSGSATSGDTTTNSALTM